MQADRREHTFQHLSSQAVSSLKSLFSVVLKQCIPNKKHRQNEQNDYEWQTKKAEHNLSEALYAAAETPLYL